MDYLELAKAATDACRQNWNDGHEHSAQHKINLGTLYALIALVERLDAIIAPEIDDPDGIHGLRVYRGNL